MNLVILLCLVIRSINTEILLRRSLVMFVWFHSLLLLLSNNGVASRGIVTRHNSLAVANRRSTRSVRTLLLLQLLDIASTSSSSVGTFRRRNRGGNQMSERVFFASFSLILRCGSPWIVSIWHRHGNIIRIFLSLNLLHWTDGRLGHRNVSGNLLGIPQNFVISGSWFAHGRLASGHYIFTTILSFLWLLLVLLLLLSEIQNPVTAVWVESLLLIVDFVGQIYSVGYC